MDIDRSVNGWFKRLSLIQKKADHYKLRQDVLSSLSDKEGFDFFVKSKGITIGAHTCILKCRCPRFYCEIVKNVDVSNLSIHLLERISDFIKCVYSEDDITAVENKLIKLINISHSIKNKRPSIDLFEPKRISCDINPLYYSLAHYDDFSSSEFSDFDQCMYDVDSVVLNQTTIGTPSSNKMDMNSNNSRDLIKSQANGIYDEANVLTNKDDLFNDQCSVNCNINESAIDSINTRNNESCEVFHHDLIIPNNLADSNHLHLERPTKCNNILDSSSNVQNDKKKNLLTFKSVNNSKDSKPYFSNDDNLLNKKLNEEYVLFNNDINSEMVQNDDDLDVVSKNNFETFTIIKKGNVTGDTYNHAVVKDSNKKSNQEPFNDKSSFQTFTVVNENVIIDGHGTQKDIILNNDEPFESETLNDYKTFTVIDKNIISPLNCDQLCVSSDSVLSKNKIFITNNDFDSNSLPSTHDPIQSNLVKLSSPFKDYKDDMTENISKNEEKKCVNSNFNIISLNNKNSDCGNMQNNILSTVNSDATLNLNFENTILESSNNINLHNLEKIKSSDESDSTLSLHLDVLESNKELNSPDSLNGDDEIRHDAEMRVSNKLEFVPLEATQVKDNRSPRFSRKYMECSPVMSANAYYSPNVEKLLSSEENSERRNSSSFFIDFNEGSKPKKKPKRFENLTKSLDSSTIATSKEKIFSMFIDFNEDSESSKLLPKDTKHRKPQTLADRFVRMHSEDTSVKNNDHEEDTVTPPPSRMTSTVENSSVDISESSKKQSVFMFIENDSQTPVKRRSLPQSSRLRSQRNSWNVDSTVVHKTHHRTHSVNLSEESCLDARMTQSHTETGSKELNKPINSFDYVEYNETITKNGVEDSGTAGLTDSFVRLSDMDKAPSKEIISSLHRSGTKSDSLRRDLKNTELGKCLKRMFPSLKTTEVERILLSKPPHSLDSKEDINSGLGQDLLRMFLEEIGADTTIDVNGRRIKAHKCILTSRCQYFAAMFSGGWVQSAGNVLYLKGFSYKTVHLTLRYIYSGECNFSEIKNVTELTKLADMLCLEGLKDNIMLYLAAEYCHFFKEVCERCTVGILECLKLSVAFGLDDLYLSCIVWISDNFSVVWSTNHFVSLPQDLKTKCFKHKVAHVDDLNDILNITEGCEKIKKNLSNDDWTKEVINLITDLSNSVVKYLAKHFYATITSKYFKQVLESENLFADSFATHLLASCNCANRNQIRQAYDHLNKSLSNNFWHAQGEMLINAIMELIVKGLAADFKNGRERQAMGSLPNDYHMSDALSQKIALELRVPRLELAANGISITSSPVKKMITNTKVSNKTLEKKIKPKTSVEITPVPKVKTSIEITPVPKVKTSGKFAEVKSRYMEPKPQITNVSPQKGLPIHKDLPRGRRTMSSSASLTSSTTNFRNTMSSSKLTNNRVDIGLRTKTSSELSLTTPKLKPKFKLPKTDPLPSSTRTSSIGFKTTPKPTKKTLQNKCNSRKMSNENIINGVKKQTTVPKTKSLPNGHPTIGSRSGTFCKDEPTVIHSKDITN